jgi:uncharacterized protein involved in exopolysaccharide biosynthesis
MMDAEKDEFSDYGNSLRRRRRLLLAIWLSIVLLKMLLAVGLPSEYGSTAPFQLKTYLNNHGGGDNYADRFDSRITRSTRASAIASGEATLEVAPLVKTVFSSG